MEREVLVTACWTLFPPHTMWTHEVFYSTFVTCLLSKIEKVLGCLLFMASISCSFWARCSCISCTQFPCVSLSILLMFKFLFHACNFRFQNIHLLCHITSSCWALPFALVARLVMRQADQQYRRGRAGDVACKSKMIGGARDVSTIGKLNMTYHMLHASHLSWVQI